MKHDIHAPSNNDKSGSWGAAPPGFRPEEAAGEDGPALKKFSNELCQSLKAKWHENQNPFNLEQAEGIGG